MDFLFPSFLWGLLALSVPLAIHLFNFRRTKKIFFSNISFLKTAETQTSSFRRLRHLLILLCRMLAIACLVLAFAQPVILDGQGAKKEAKGITSLYLDNSFSMQNERSNKRLLDIATTGLNELLTLFKHSGSIQLVTNDFSAGENALQTASAVGDRLTSVELSHLPRTLEQVHSRQNQLLSGRGAEGKNQLFWFSDFQKSTAGDLSEIRPDSTRKLFLVPVQADPEKNVYVDSVWLNTPFIRELQQNILHVKLNNSGTSGVNNLAVKLFLDETQVSAASVSIPAEGSARASFHFNIRGSGYKKGKITFDDFPVTFDNDYFFVLNASPKIKIAHLSDRKTEQDYVGHVFQNDSLFEITSYNSANFDPGVLGRADLVVTEGLAGLSGTLQSALTGFVRKGGSLAVIPPDRPDEKLYGPFLSALGVTGLRTTGDPADKPVVPLALPDKKNPFFSDVFEQSMRQDQIDLPAMSPVWQADVRGPALLSLKDGRPALSHFTADDGKIYLFGTPLEPQFGNLARHALFVPVMYKIAALSVKAQRTAFTFSENPIVIPVGAERSDIVYKLRRGKAEITPVQRLVNGQLHIELPANSQLDKDQQLGPGYYELINPTHTGQLLALNHDHLESDLSCYTPDELRRVFAGRSDVTVYDQLHDADFLREFERQNIGITLWKYFIYAAIAFFLAEILIARLMR